MNILWQIFVAFLKVGTFTFGGGPAMLPVIRKEVVDKGWMADEEFVDCLAVAQSLPGAFAVNASVYVGRRISGLPGAVVAAIAIALPAFVSIVVILLFLGKIEDNRYVQGAFEGVKAATTGLVLVAAYKTGKQILTGWFEIMVAAASFFMIVWLGLSVVWAILFSGAAGYVLYAVRKARQKQEGGQ